MDRQQEYKLTFPRGVVATAWSRNLHIDHQPIEDVRLIDVLSRKQENWTLKLVANGRLVQYEGFRNRQEAYLWSSLSRKIFNSSDVDIARIIGHTLKADKLDLPNLSRLTISWAWEPKLAQSATQNALIRMLATANALVA